MSVTTEALDKQDIDTGIALDTPHESLMLRFYVPALNSSEQDDERAVHLQELIRSWSRSNPRDSSANDGEWIESLDHYLQQCVLSRLEHVRLWLDINTARFQTDITTFQVLRREYDALSVTVKAGVQLCKLQCGECNLLCLKGRHHSEAHDCLTSHACAHHCGFTEEHPNDNVLCGLPSVPIFFCPR